MTEARVSEPAIVGREAELARVAGFLSTAGPTRCLTLAGEPGIGKTTLWEAGLAEARATGSRVLVARALLLGRQQRRARKRAAARTSLESAVAAFDRLGSEGWSEQARAELGRIGGRRPAADGALTRTEARVAELAAAGQSNKEIAAALVVSVYTVERHLKHAYAKLGIRSRSQLAGRLGRPQHA